MHEAQKIFYEDAPYAVMWYDPIFLGLALRPVRGLYSAAAAERRPARRLGRHQRGVALASARGRRQWWGFHREQGHPARGLGARILAGSPDPDRGYRADPASQDRGRGRVGERQGNEKTGWERAASILSKVLQAFLTLAFVMVFNFFLFRVIPGDSAALLLRGTAAYNQQNVEHVTQDLGLDRPLPQQFLV